MTIRLGPFKVNIDYDGLLGKSYYVVKPNSVGCALKVYEDRKDAVMACTN